MPSYTFVIKKENMVFEFTTDSKSFIDKEFEKWINAMSENEAKTKKEPKSEPKVEPVKQPEKAISKEIEQELSNLIDETIVATSKPLEPVEEVVSEGDIVIDNEAPSAFQKLSRKLSEETFEEPADEKVEKVVEKPVTFIEDDVELEFASVSIDGEGDLVELEEVDFSDSEFDAIFQEKINSDVDEYSVKENKKFLSFKQGKNLEKPVDGLVLIAKYLLDVENKDRFVMKDIMELSKENAIKDIDYALITKAVSVGVVKVVPDLTGIADVVEYALTPKGEDYFND